MSKVMEKFIYRRLLSVINQIGVIPEHQFGFRERHSTVEQVSRVASTICNAFENKKFRPALFLDISQTFDRVWIPGLLSKILSSCVPKQQVLLVESYLQLRNFYVAYGEAKSATLPIDTGVPQGSVLGPLLHLLYTADLPVQPGSTVATYADDTAVLTPHISYETATELLQNSAREVEHWAHQWKI